MMFTLNQAAKASGRSKGTISKALAKGQLSYVSKTDKGYQIDAAELFRVFPKNVSAPKGKVRLETGEKPSENIFLEREIALLREQMEMMVQERERERCLLNSSLEDLQKDRDYWRQQAVGLLEDKRPRKWRLFGGNLG